MINFEGMKSEARGASYPMLPEGPYIAEIKGVNIEGTVPNQSLVIRVDITEGEHAGYFTKRYQHDSAAGGQYAVKYKGDFRLRIPHPASNSQYPESDKRNFNDAIYRIEGSNPGFHWDGDETKLKGLRVGINMQEGSYNDSTYTAIGRLEIVDDIRSGLVKAMKKRKPRYDETYITAEATSGGFTPAGDVEIPF